MKYRLPDMQLEFPFTKQGAIFAYNSLQSARIKSLFENQPSSSYLDNYELFVQQYCNNGEAKAFYDRYAKTYFSGLVEESNARTLDKWDRNHLVPARWYHGQSRISKE